MLNDGGFIPFDTKLEHLPAKSNKIPEIKFEQNIKKNKPTAQAAVADPSRWNYTIRKNPPVHQIFVTFEPMQ